MLGIFFVIGLYTLGQIMTIWILCRYIEGQGGRSKPATVEVIDTVSDDEEDAGDADLRGSNIEN